MTLDAGALGSETPEQHAARMTRAALWAERHARRAAIVEGAADWQEGCRRLYAAGELSAGMLEALGLRDRAD